jgi:peptidoglycan/xylan/chitin deacetylase (PgdA/CDA1 family)
MNKKVWGLIFLIFFFFSKEAFSKEAENPWDKIILRIDDVPPLSKELVKTIHEVGIKHIIVGIIGKNLLNSSNESIEILKKGVKEGWIIYNHSYSHKKGTYYQKHLEELKREIEKTQKLIEEILQYSPKVFACPGGKQNLSRELEKIVREMGLEIDEGWDIDTRDWDSENSLSCEEIAKQIKEKLKRKEKIIILIHGTKKRWIEDLKKIDSFLKTQIN